MCLNPVKCKSDDVILLQSEADQETEKDDAPASPVSPSGMLVTSILFMTMGLI